MDFQTYKLNFALVFCLIGWATPALAQDEWPHYSVDWDDRLFRARVQGAYDWKGSSADRQETTEFTPVAIPYYQLGTNNRDLTTFPPRPEIDPEAESFFEPKDWRDRRLLIQYLQNNAVIEEGYFENNLDEDAVADTYYLMGNIYFMQSKFEQAIANYDRAIEAFPDFKLAYKNKAYAYATTGSCPLALEAAREAVARGAFGVHIKSIQAYCAFEADDYEAALEASAHSRMLDPNVSQMLLVQIQSLVNLGQYERAIPLVRQIDNQNIANQLALTVRLAQGRAVGDESEQLALLEIKSRLDGLSDTDRSELIRLKIKNGLAYQVNDDELLRFFETDVESGNLLGPALESIFESDELNSLESFKNSVVLPTIGRGDNVDVGGVETLLASIELQQGNVESAKNILIASITNNPLSCQALLLLSEIENDLDNDAESDSYSNRAISTSPNCDNTTLERRALMRASAGDFSGAEDLMRRDWNQKIARGEIPDEFYVRKYRAIATVSQRTGE